MRKVSGERRVQLGPVPAGDGWEQAGAYAVVPLTTLAQRLERSLRVSAAAGACGIIGVLLVMALVVSSSWLLVIVIAAVSHQAALLVARRLCRRGRVATAAVTFCLTDWAMVAVALVIVPPAAPALVPIIIARVVSTLPYLHKDALLRLVAASVAAGVVVGALSRMDLVGAAEQVPGWVLTAFVMFFVPVGFAVVGLDLWQHSATLLETARGALEANARLRASQRALAEQADELARSRSRLVAAADMERRRLERDLHDGAQQTLTGLCLGVSQLARRHKDAPVTAELLRLEEIAQEAVTELRELAHGVYPPVLASQGLAPALEAVLRRHSLPVRAAIEPVGRRPPEQEAAVYFCCREALQNIEKHAGPAAAPKLTLTEDDTGTLSFSVTDTGRGFDARNGTGQGLVNMRDRLAAVGGEVTVRSTPDGGTVVAGRLPPPAHSPLAPASDAAAGGAP